MSFFKMTASPHVHGNESTSNIMLDVIIALVPAIVWGVYAFGTRTLSIIAVCVISAVLTEYLYRKIARKNNTVSDLSAVVTGLLLSLTLPVRTPLWVCVLGCVFAIAVVKQLFGGIGKNIVNPALAARAFLFSAFPGYLTEFTEFGNRFPWLDNESVDVVTCATPLGNPEISESIFDLFIGKQAGSVGEISEALLLIGGIYLLLSKVISWHIPVTFISTVAIVSFLFPTAGASSMEFMLREIFSGGLFIGAFFMATDYVTSPVTSVGRIIYGVGCGLIPLFIRYFGGYPEGVSFAILIMNLLVWYIDMFTRPRAFGGGKNAKAN